MRSRQREAVRDVAAAARESAGDDAARRRELSDFLRNRRAEIAPEDVGLPGGGRRRTPGLRREEVAQLAGVGTTWYTWLEQARDVRASQAVLEALADALSLTPAERRHLVLLGRGEVAPEHRNQLWLFFTDPARRALMPDWNRTARVLASRFRADYARHVGDPAFDRLVSDLQDASPAFRKWWTQHEVKGDTDGRKEILHPVEGRMLFEHAAFKHIEHGEQRLFLYSPLPDEDTPAKMERLLSAR